MTIIIVKKKKKRTQANKHLQRQRKGYKHMKEQEDQEKEN